MNTEPNNWKKEQICPSCNQAVPEGQVGHLLFHGICVSCAIRNIQQAKEKGWEIHY